MVDMTWMAGSTASGILTYADAPSLHMQGGEAGRFTIKKDGERLILRLNKDIACDIPCTRMMDQPNRVSFLKQYAEAML